MKVNFKILLGIFAIIVGLIAIVRIVGNIELIVAALSFSFGIMAIIWVNRARTSLSEGSLLKEYATYYLASLSFILAATLWGIFEDLFFWNNIPRYILIAVAYLIFVMTAYKMWKIGKEFGFKEKVDVIKRRIKSKK